MVDNWDEIRTAFHVARLGTVSGAADVLGVHHATVIRHIDSLEGRLGIKLFQRHARGYTPTEAGDDLMKVAMATDDQFSQLVGRIKGRGAEVTGEIVITTVAGIAAILTPMLTKFQQQYPDLKIRYITDQRVFRLEYGEAHVAIRAGKTPQEPDNVVQPFLQIKTQLCAAQSYVDRFGLPASEAEFPQHSFVGNDVEGGKAPSFRWMLNNVPRANVVYRATETDALERAVVAGQGIGFIADWRMCNYPNLIKVMDPLDEWAAQLWLVTHVDLHRTTKVQALVNFLKAEAKALT